MAENIKIDMLLMVVPELELGEEDGAIAAASGEFAPGEVPDGGDAVGADVGGLFVGGLVVGGEVFGGLAVGGGMAAQAKEKKNVKLKNDEMII